MASRLVLSVPAETLVSLLVLGVAGLVVVAVVVLLLGVVVFVASHSAAGVAASAARSAGGRVRWCVPARVSTWERVVKEAARTRVWLVVVVRYCWAVGGRVRSGVGGL
jgi:hypothetical protein